MGYIFVQIGAGAGDLDSRANFRDGFTELVKRIPKADIDRIVLVEPNPLNIDSLTRCWKDYPQAEIHAIGLRTSSQTDEQLTFYYAEEDGPHFQVFSMRREHVVKHYPNGHIVSVQVKTQGLKKFIDEVIGADNKISLLSLDIEGIDAEVILDTDWKNINCEKLSFEHLHLGRQQEEVLRHLGRAGYIFIGNGVDVNGFDFMYEKL